MPGESEPKSRPLAGRARGRRGGVPRRGRRRRGSTAAGLRLEDKGPIQALHWRGAAGRGARRGGRPTRSRVEAGRAGLEPHWGRKVLELRPVGGGGKGAAVASLLAEDGVDRVVYAGDDRTDVDAFRRLARAARGGRAGRRGPGRRPLRRGAAGDRRGVRRHRRGPGRLARDPHLARGVTQRCPTPTCCASRSSSPAPRRPRSGRSARSRSAANRARRPSSSPSPGGLIALILGFWLGRPGARRRGHARAARPRPTATSLPSETPGPHRDRRLWPIAAHRGHRRRPRPLLPRRRDHRHRLRPDRLPRLAHPRGRRRWRSRSATASPLLRRPQLAPCSPIELVRTPGLRSDRAARDASRLHFDAATRVQMQTVSFFSSFLNSAQVRVLATSALVSQARRAVATA